jgi:hypothetical protein
MLLNVPALKRNSVDDRNAIILFEGVKSSVFKIVRINLVDLARKIAEAYKALRA